MRVILLLLLLIVFTACAGKPALTAPTQIEEYQRVERVDVPRLLAGDLRYNLRIRDGDVLIASNEVLFADKVNKPLGLIPDRVRPYRTPQPQYMMKQGDVLLVTIYELREPGVDHQQQRRIDERGRIYVEHVGVLPAAGLSTSELEMVLIQRLQDKVILRDATVSVQALETHRSYTLHLPWRALGETIEFQQPELRMSHVLDSPDLDNIRSLRYVHLIRQK